MASQSQPVSPTITQALSLSGVTANGGVSGDTSFFLSGSAAPGAYLLVSDGENDLSITQASRVGTWGSAVQAGPGQHFYTVRHLNKSRSPQWIITVDLDATTPYASPAADALIEEFETGVPGEIPEGSWRKFPNLSVTAIAGDISVYLADPSPSIGISGNCIRFRPLEWSGSVRFDLNEGASDVYFNCYHEGQSIHEKESWRAYDEQGLLIAFGYFDSAPWQNIHGYGLTIKSIVVSGGVGLEYMLIDFVSFYTYDCECK
ncbi:hypothetical protein [Pseudomonas sp. ICMP 561]|uniref:hypothetical protein n=1 Tax=Pseudomonas sp. ICMP 561 TaxID=1718918 RepID=UPI000C06FB24|nr:hypothetical protein [Pseudomonas sp. ICMP 561]PHN21145.1 hypothetical protein AO242_03970 [Pseudomonas sp. ICMP 561]